MNVPSITAAAVVAAKDAMGHSTDRMIRVEAVDGVSWTEFCQQLDPDGIMRFGFLSPQRHLPEGLKGARYSCNPRLITCWRNSPPAERKGKPIVLLGNAIGSAEAGLRRVPRIVTQSHVIEIYGGLIQKHLKATVQSKTPWPFARSLLEMADDGLIGMAELSRFFGECFRSDQDTVTRPQKLMWILRLLPDDRALDSKNPRERLMTNYRVTQLLQTQADTAVEEAQLERLETAARAGDACALAAIEFRALGDKSFLARVELDKLLNVMARSGTKPSNGKLPRPMQIHAALDEALVTKEALTKIGGAWDLEEQSVSVSIACGGKSVAFEAKADEGYPFVDVKAQEQVIATRRDSGRDLADASEIMDVVLREQAGISDAVIGTARFAPLVADLLAARREILPVAAWHETLLTLLMTKAEVLEDAEKYLESWQRLVGEIVDSDEKAATDGLAELVSRLDSHCEVVAGIDGGAETISAMELMPIHPFVLKPIVELAKVGLATLGEKDLGQRLRWAFDRVLPAYPAVWQGKELLVHDKDFSRPRFSTRGLSALRPVSSTVGLLDVCRAFVGLHPYAKKHLSLLLIDPPSGGGVIDALRSLVDKGHVEDLTAFTANTDRREVDFSGLEEHVRHLGTVGTGTEWVNRSHLAVNLAVVFQRAARVHGGSHSGQMQPSRGLHNSLAVSLKPPQVVGPEATTDRRWTAHVVVEPRDSNDVVCQFMKLSRQSSAVDQLYEVVPMLGKAQEENLRAVGEICDWLVVATPSPIGLVPPRKFENSNLAFIGREDFGPYALFVYGRDFFALRKRLEQSLIEAPFAPDPEKVEKRIELLARDVPNGVLRLGLSQGSSLSQIGLIAASHLARGSAL